MAKAMFKRKPRRAPAGDELNFPLVPYRLTPSGVAEEKSAEERAKLLAMIHELASLQFDAHDIAIVVQAPASDMTGGDEDCTVAFDSGRLLAEARVRKMLLRMAEAGSSPAQKMVLEIADYNKRKAAAGQESGPSSVEIETVRKHLIGLNLAPAETSTIELARLAVARIIELESRPQ